MSGEKKFFSIFCILSAILILNTVFTPVAGAINSPIESLRINRALYNIFKENNLMFWNPFEEVCVPSFSEDEEEEEEEEEEVDGGGGVCGSTEKLEWAMENYADVAMSAQKEYGTPWEVVFAQMVHESCLGTAGVARYATNNWLGITGSGDAGTYISSSGRKWAKFSSLEQSILSWAGKKVLRNGYYDDAFSSLDPNNYNLREFLVKMIHHYAPASDGNDETNYVNTVMNLINGKIKTIREKLGLPSSEEYAKENNIGIGGNNPIGSSVSDSLSSSSSKNSDKTVHPIICANTDNDEVIGDGDSIADLAMELAWPGDGHEDEVKPEFADAARALGNNPTLGWSQDCGHFAGVVIRTAADPSFPASGTGSISAYLASSPKWKEIENTGSTSNLEPGDVLILRGAGSGHVIIYVGDGKKASASQSSYTGKIGNMGSSSFSEKRGKYKIYRFIGN